MFVLCIELLLIHYGDVVSFKEIVTNFSELDVYMMSFRQAKNITFLRLPKLKKKVFYKNEHIRLKLKLPQKNEIL